MIRSQRKAQKEAQKEGQKPAQGTGAGAVVHDEPRRRPSTIGGVVYLVVLAVEVAGLAVVAFGPWRRGIAVMGSALLLAAVARASLPRRDAGMLAVRSRWFDVVALVVVGAGLVVLARVIPDQAG